MMFWISKDFKKRILASDFLYKIAVSFENIRFLFYNRIKTSGKKNLIKKDKGTVFRNVKIKIKGDENKIIFGKRCRFRNVNIEIIGSNNKIIIFDKVNFMEGGKFLIEGDNCIISIGENTLFRNANLFAGESQTKIEIGNNCFCGIVNFSTSDFHSILDRTTGHRINKAGNIIVGNNNWITNGVNIRKGTIIMNDTVIAANSFVNAKFINSNIIIAGQPAKVVKENIVWSREKL
jgi:acetyltransferase-like isoleucine patch superfamily enzyme